MAKLEGLKAVRTAAARHRLVVAAANMSPELRRAPVLPPSRRATASRRRLALAVRLGAIRR